MCSARTSRAARWSGSGLGREALGKLNPRLIYVSHKGFLPGPYEQRTALDEVVQMMGGLAYMTGPEGQPLRAGTSVNDIMGGMFGAIGALAALHQRDKQLHRQRPRPGGAQRAVREQRAARRAAHDAVRRDRRARRADARPHLGLGRVRRVHGEGRRTDLPRRRLRHAVGAVLRRLRPGRPEGRCAPGEQQPARAGATLADARAARAPGRPQRAGDRRRLRGAGPALRADHAAAGPVRRPAPARRAAGSRR